MNQWHILVVEDDKDGQEVVSRMLKHHRIAHSVTGSGEEAIQFLQEYEVTACIIDLALPGIDGWGILQYIQSTPGLQHLPCIAVTAYHSVDVAQKALEAGFAAYFPKPLEATSFVRQVTGIIEQY